MALGTGVGKSPETKTSHPHFFCGEFAWGPVLIRTPLHHLRIVRLCFIRRWLGIYVNLDSGQVLEAKC